MKKRITVVLADADADSRAALQRALKNAADFELLDAVGSGTEALRLVQEKRPQLLLADVSLPGLDGLSLLTRVATLSPRPRVLLLSAFYTDRLAAQACARGAALLFAKPVEPANLLDRCRDVCAPAPCGETSVLEQRVTDILREVGIPSHIKGYHYLHYGILLAADDAALLHAVTKSLYPQVARRFGATAGCVERAIRSAIESAWERGDPAALQKYFGSTVSRDRGKPTNGQFIALIAEELCLRKAAF